MKQKSFGFIGGGRVTRILLGGWERKNELPERIVVSDPNPEVLQALKKRFPQVETVNDNKLAAGQDVVFVSLHPPVLGGLLVEVKGALASTSILISLAPKVSIAKLTEILGGFDRIVRMIPNAPSIVNQGYNPVVFSPAFSAAERNQLQNMFHTLGSAPEVAESKLEAYAIFTAMGPTYFWFQLYQLKELGRSFGLDEAELQAGIRGMAEGMVGTMVESGLAPHEVMDLVPVKPLAEEEATIMGMYQNRLTGLYQKLKS